MYHGSGPKCVWKTITPDRHLWTAPYIISKESLDWLTQWERNKSRMLHEIHVWHYAAQQLKASFFINIEIEMTPPPGDNHREIFNLNWTQFLGRSTNFEHFICHKVELVTKLLHTGLFKVDSFLSSEALSSSNSCSWSIHGIEPSYFLNKTNINKIIFINRKYWSTLNSTELN